MEKLLRANRKQLSIDDHSTLPLHHHLASNSDDFVSIFGGKKSNESQYAKEKGERGKSISILWHFRIHSFIWHGFPISHFSIGRNNTVNFGGSEDERGKKGVK